MDYFVDMGLAVLFSVLKNTVKNPQKKLDMKAAFLKLRNTINTTYANDPDFQ